MSRVRISKPKADRLEEEIYFGCDALRKANQFAENGVNSKIGELRKQKETLAQSRMTIDEQQMLERVYSYDMDHARDIVQNLIRASMVVVIFGFFEAFLKRIVTKIDNSVIGKNEKDVIIKKRKKVIANCVKLMQNNASINIPIFFDSELELLTEIRNAYAHNSGILRRTETTKVKNIVKDIGGTANLITSFKINKTEPNVYTIEFYSQFVEEFIDKIEDSLYDILGQLRLRI